MADEQRLGRYIIEEQLGEGSFAWVYRGYDEELDRRVAVKVLKPIWLSDLSAVTRFKTEARTMAKLDHSNIAVVYEVGEAEGQVFLAQRLVDGGTLSEQMEKTGTLSWPDALNILRQVASALDYAHENGMIHRDIKPANILVNNEGRAFLGDFGLVRAAEGSASISASTGGMVGTPAYMAPEQWKNEPITPATDVYALSCVVFEMLTGHMLFDAENPASVMTQHVLEGPKFPDTWPEDVPKQIVEVLKRGLAANSSDRISSAGELVAELEKAEKGLVEAAPPAKAVAEPIPSPEPARATSPAAATAAAPPAKKSGVPVMAIVGVVVVLVIAGAGFFIFGGGGGGNDGNGTEPPSESQSASVAAVPTEEEEEPTAVPTEVPTDAPTAEPTDAPTETPTEAPTPVPPTATPEPTEEPTEEPTAAPVAQESTATPEPVAVEPTEAPTEEPTAAPATQEPTATPEPVADISGHIAIPLMVGNEPRVFVVDTKGNQVHVLESARQPTHTLNGSKLLVNGEGGAQLLLRSANSDGSGAQEFGNPTLSSHSHPTWSPDGNSVLYLDRFGTQEYHMFTRDIDSTEGEGEEIFASGNGPIFHSNPMYPQWSNSGIVFRGCSTWIGQGGDCGTWLLSGQQGSASKITGDVNHIPTDVSGNTVVFSWNQGNWDVYTADIHSGSVTQLTNDPAQDALGTISPDGKSVAFLSNRGGGLAVWRVDIGGGTPEKMFDIPSAWGSLRGDGFSEETLSWGK